MHIDHSWSLHVHWIDAALDWCCLVLVVDGTRAIRFSAILTKTNDIIDTYSLPHNLFDIIMMHILIYILIQFIIVLKLSSSSQS
jgi:hypothetical protein